MMYGREKAGSAIVAGKPTNKAERSAAEPVEPRAEAKGNAGRQSTHRAQYRERVSKALACIRQHIVAVDTRGGSRMRESCTYGSVRGARGNSRPYRDRREFIALLGGAAVAWPLQGRAQQSRKLPRIGVLWHAGNEVEEAKYLAALRQGFNDLGYVEGKTYVLENRFAAEKYERFNSLAAELVAAKVDVL